MAVGCGTPPSITFHSESTWVTSFDVSLSGSRSTVIFAIASAIAVELECGQISTSDGTVNGKRLEYFSTGMTLFVRDGYMVSKKFLSAATLSV